ncbi:Hypothetical predicted protein [Mytilus galloprovincialis]|uniref:EF-hand domain-containing protein n=1 Tax=Mytilus galloprovincialis TaxID=29158 RepID=A0A8B6C8F3_MYTGA|nr:Hypothetical predicted protein [Mytilus galloprovincialis]
MVDKLKNDLRAKCLERGAIGLHGITRTFQNMDVDHDNLLSLTEFTDGLKKYGLTFEDETAHELFTYIDKTCRGSIKFEEFLLAIRPPMSEKRIEIINKAFAKFDKETGDGVITLEDLREDYDVGNRRSYKSGFLTKDQVLSEFLQVFNKGSEDVKVTKEEFTNYYSGLGANIDTDEEFVKMMTTAWKI